MDDCRSQTHVFTSVRNSIEGCVRVAFTPATLSTSKGPSPGRLENGAFEGDINLSGIPWQTDVSCPITIHSCGSGGTSPRGFPHLALGGGPTFPESLTTSVGRGDVETQNPSKTSLDTWGTGGVGGPSLNPDSRTFLYLPDPSTRRRS